MIISRNLTVSAMSWSVSAAVIVSVYSAVQAVAVPPDHDRAVLRATQEVFHSVAERLKPYIVRIDTVGGSQGRGAIATSDDEGGEPRRSQSPFRDTPGSSFVVADGSTTGIVYSSEGYIVTSSFNFVREPVLISVTLPDGRRLAADLIARDQVRRIALLKVDAVGLPVPIWTEPDSIHVGDWAIALGLGFGGDAPSITAGIVSAFNRMHGNAIQTDAKLSPANYGGPLCDIHGRVIGICVPMAQRPGELAGVEMYDSGIGFALPKHRVDTIVAGPQGLMSGRSFYRGWLGISVDPHSSDEVLITNVAIPSPMHAAGVAPGDRIVGAAGKTVRHYGDLVQALYMIPAGEEVEVLLERDGGEFAVAVPLARGRDLGPLPEAEEPFDPSSPLPGPSDDE